MKKDLIKIFIDEIYNKPANKRKKYPTNKIVYNHIDEIWSIGLAGLSDYKTSNDKRFRFLFVITDDFSKVL